MRITTVDDSLPGADRRHGDAAKMTALAARIADGLSLSTVASSHHYLRSQVALVERPGAGGP
ncbi:MAG: hypothetical protein R2717_00630 [Schumannella sp.]